MWYGDESGCWSYIKYYGGKKTFRYISYYDVWKKRLPGSIFKDKIALIGASAPGLMDLRSTPIDPAYPGVEIHATIIQNILNNNFFSRHRSRKYT